MREVLGKYKNIEERQENDYYATDPQILKALLKVYPIKGKKILEPCAGECHLSKVLEKDNTVITNDLIIRSKTLDYNLDFLKEYKSFKNDNFDIVLTNPPFKHLQGFILNSLEIADEVIIFGRIQILETIKRYEEIFSKGYLKKVFVFTNRVITAKNGDFKKYTTNAMCFCWYIFEKKYKGKPEIEWLFCEKEIKRLNKTGRQTTLDI